MRLSSTLLAVVVALPSTGAIAADLGPSDTYPPSLEDQAKEWTGFYIGVQGGAGFGSVDADFKLIADTPVFNASQDYDVDGALFGGLAGYSYQWMHLVVGVEADISYSGIDAQSSEINDGVRDRYETDIPWYGTLRGRIGYAFDPLLLYGTGGLAFGEVRDKYVDPQVVSNSFSLSDTETGFTVGGGLEWAFASNWRGRVSYDYVDFGDQRLFFEPKPTANFTRFDTNFSTVRVGLSYRF
jgi:outer membrane immunogenic protein